MELSPEKCAVIFRNNGHFLYVCYHCCKSFATGDKIILHIQNDHATSDFLTETDIKEEDPCEYSLVADEIPSDQWPALAAIDWRKEMEDEEDCETISDSNDNVPVFEMPLQANNHNQLASVHDGKPPASTTKPADEPEEFRLNCDICRKHFDDIDSLKNHLIRQHGKGGTRAEPYKCSLCGQMYAKSSRFLMHLNRSHSLTTSLRAKKYLHCDLCGEQFDGKQKLKYHLLNHVNLNQFNCSTCAIGFHNKLALNMHNQRNHGLGKFVVGLRTAIKSTKYKCTKCSLIFKHRVSRRKHFKLKHADAKSYVCEMCLAQFITLRAYRLHINKQHSRERAYKCKLCAKAFYSSTTRSYHVKTNHATTTQLYECDHCGKQFNCREYVTRHMSNFHSGRVFKCKYCTEFETPIKTNLEYHMRKIHALDRLKAEQMVVDQKRKNIEESKHKCKQCNRMYETEAKLEKHVKYVHSEKPFECDQCNKKFGCKPYLSHHVFICHSGNTFKCDQCEFVTTTRSNLKNHLRNMHSNELRYVCENCSQPFKYWLTYVKHGKVCERR